MKQKFFTLFFLFFITLGLCIHDAEARRFGGGRSFGVARSASSFSTPSSAVSSTYNYARNEQAFRQQTSPLKSTLSRWAGPLAGLVAGGLLASLLMGKGIGSGILSWLLIAGGLLLLFTLFRRMMQPAPQYQSQYTSCRDEREDSNSYYRAPEENRFAQDAMSQFYRNNNECVEAPPAPASFNSNQSMGFDAATFLREAKVQFIRLQAANDQKNVNDLRQFTTPEVLAEIQMQWHERGEAENTTNVVSLDAELLGVDPASTNSLSSQPMLASVRFTGMIQEDPSQPAAAFTEIWHFRKETMGTHWLVAGVQQ